MAYVFRGLVVPEGLMEGLHNYATFGLPPGSFLSAVICNDLVEACGRGDPESLRNLPAIVAWLYNEAPAECWGSREKMDAWIKYMAEQRQLARSGR